VIVVVGSLAWRASEPAGPTGRACAVALAAAASGAPVELVGRAGDDPAGDALLLALSRLRVGHAAVLRDPSRPTPVASSTGVPDDDEAASPFRDEAPGPAALSGADPGGRPRLEPADISLAMRYLDPSGVLVVTDDVPPDALAAAVDESRFAGMRLVVILGPGTRPGESVPAGLPPDATVLVAPADADAEPGAFEALVGAYAAALDRGVPPEAAFAAAAGAGWEALAATD
jgi:sugar/nucleoside kinase (ribokinase family)